LHLLPLLFSPLYHTFYLLMQQFSSCSVRKQVLLLSSFACYATTYLRGKTCHAGRTALGRANRRWRLSAGAPGAYPAGDDIALSDVQRYLPAVDGYIASPPSLLHSVNLRANDGIAAHAAEQTGRRRTGGRAAACVPFAATRRLYAGATNSYFLRGAHAARQPSPR
jgi:hypothetical protein